MKNKIIFIICAISISVIGFWGGFTVTRAFTSHSPSSVAVLASKQDFVEKVPTDDEVQREIGKEKVLGQTTKVNNINNSCPKPKKEYEDESDLDVGQDVSLIDKSYIPSDLVELDKTISKPDGICVKAEVADTLEDLLEAAKKDGHIIIVSSGFRDYNTQKSIVDRETKNGNEHVAVAVAKPGYSEHQLGVTVDLTSKSIAYASAAGKFAYAPEYKWLEEHASQFGFVQSYPKGKESITGYMYEPWHYRYVGIESAKEIIKNGQTVNEYLKEKKENKIHQ